MKVTVIGTGYVGLVTGTCFADSGEVVTCVDIVQAKIDALRRGVIPIFEPGLAELVATNATKGRLHFTTDMAAAVRQADVVYLAVGTPQANDGAADLASLRKAAESLAPHLRDEAAVVIKSTVPVGTNAEIARLLQELTGREIDVASNPEFLKEGTAIDDFLNPDRVVVGVRRAEVADVLNRLYKPFLKRDRPFLVMSPESAELTKYVANAMLATKISFINEMSNICQKAGGDIDAVRQGIGHDPRIGFAFLAPGVGYGGSCFPKDVRALAHTARSLGIEPQMLNTVDEVNERQKHVMADWIFDYFGDDLRNRTIAVWGLAFKPNTDDIREAPALVLIKRLRAAGAEIVAYDPEATENVRNLIGDQIAYVDNAWDALADADALAINTEWDEFRGIEPQEIALRLRGNVVFDGRNVFDPEAMHAAGLRYLSIGRQPVDAPRKPLLSAATC